MEITYRTRLRDLIWFNFYILFRLRAPWITLGVLLLILLGPQAYVLFTRGVSLAGVLYLVQELFRILAVCTVLILLLVSLSLLIQCLRGARSVCRMLVSEGGVHAENPRGDRDLKWTSIKQVRQSRNHILIFLPEQTAYVIPKRTFTSEAEADRFFAYCYEHWEKAFREIRSGTLSPTYQEASLQKRSSGLGIASILLSTVLIVPLMIVPAANSIAGGLDETLSLLTGVLLILGIFCCIVGILVGVAGLFQRNRSKELPILGILFNVGLVLFVGWILANPK